MACEWYHFCTNYIINYKFPHLQLSKFPYLQHIFCLIFSKKMRLFKEISFLNVREEKSSFQIIFYLNLQLSKFPYLQHIFCLIFNDEMRLFKSFLLQNVREEKNLHFKEMHLFKAFSYKK